MFRFFSKVLGVSGYIIQYGCLTHCTFEYLGDFVMCSGPSMEPTLYTNNILVTERISPRLKKIQRGDIIVARDPTKPSQFICKRVVGLPGDKIKAQPPYDFSKFKLKRDFHQELIRSKHDNDDKTIFQEEDDDKEDEPQVNKRVRPIEIVVPRGHVWIEGDNAENSADSRYYGPIPQGLIKSRAVCRLWPLSDMKLLM